ncbi:MAG: glycosyltransferase, partial [Atopobiaceae bacterium]|nr:glycosyltransferase [Atopobiaceae bacterium]
FVSCDDYLPPVDAASERRLRKVSTTEMSVRSFQITEQMDPVISSDVERYRPDIVVSDSACFWGKLTAQKHGLPLVTSTTTFAFNQQSAQYMKSSASEIADIVLGLPRTNRALRKLRPLGYHVKSALDIIQNKEHDDTIVYTSAHFQPCAESFDPAHYRFVGPSLRPVKPADKTGERPLVYVSLGTVINDHPGFYRSCIDAQAGEPIDLLISCGQAFDPSTLGALPANVRVEHSVDQLDVLSRSSLFLTHCGMNSVSEALYLGVPLLLFPLTGEQRAVARRVEELGAGILLDAQAENDSALLREAILSALQDEALAESAARMREDLSSCVGPTGAADFIESVAAAN